MDHRGKNTFFFKCLRLPLDLSRFNGEICRHPVAVALAIRGSVFIFFAVRFVLNSVGVILRVALNSILLVTGSI